MPALDEALIPLDQPLSPLAQALVAGCLALAQQLGQPVPAITDPAALTGAQGLELIHETLGDLFPCLRPAASDHRAERGADDGLPQRDRRLVRCSDRCAAETFAAAMPRAHAGLRTA